MPARKKGITPAQRTFIETYVSNGFNATAAYLTAHPNVKRNVAATEGWKYLRNPEIKAALARRIDNYWKAIQMSGDEVLGRLALDARSDIRQAFDADGKLLKVSDWPDELVNSVASFTVENGRIQLTSKIAARRILAEITKKLKPTTAGQLARILAGDYEEDADE